jgi:hypothetical protein
MIKKIFNYIEPIWLGNDNKLSIRRILSLIFSIDFIINMSHIIRKWEAHQSYADAALLLGVEAGLIAALLSLTTYSNTTGSKSHNDTNLNIE